MIRVRKREIEKEEKFVVDFIPEGKEAKTIFASSCCKEALGHAETIARYYKERNGREIPVSVQFILWSKNI